MKYLLLGDYNSEGLLQSQDATLLRTPAASGRHTSSSSNKSLLTLQIGSRKSWTTTSMQVFTGAHQAERHRGWQRKQRQTLWVSRGIKNWGPWQWRGDVYRKNTMKQLISVSSDPLLAFGFQHSEICGGWVSPSMSTYFCTASLWALYFVLLAPAWFNSRCRKSASISVLEMKIGKVYGSTQCLEKSFLSPFICIKPANTLVAVI